MNQCLKTIIVKTMVKIFNNSKTSGWSTYYCIVFMFFSVYQTSVTHCNFLGSNHRKISIFWLRLELLEVNVKAIKNIPFIWQLLKKKAKKSCHLGGFEKKKWPFYRNQTGMTLHTRKILTFLQWEYTANVATTKIFLAVLMLIYLSLVFPKK